MKKHHLVQTLTLRETKTKLSNVQLRLKMENVTVLDISEQTTHDTKQISPFVIYFRISQFFLLSLGVMITFSNVIIIRSFLCNKDVREALVNVYIFYLAVADFSVGVVALSLSAIWGIAGFPSMPSYLCGPWTVVAQFSFMSSTVVILALSFDRLQLVSDPIRYKTTLTPAKVHQRVLVSLALCLTYCTLLYLFTYTAAYENTALLPHGACFTTFDVISSYPLIVNGVNFFVPLISLVALNGLFFVKLVQRMHLMMVDKHVGAADLSIKKDKGSDATIRSSTTVSGSSFENTMSFTTTTTTTHRPKSAEVNPVLERKSKCEVPIVTAVEESYSKDSGCKHESSVNSKENDFEPVSTVHSKTEHQVKQNRSLTTRRERESARLRRTAKKLTTYVLVFLVCWVPFTLCTWVPRLGIPPSLGLALTYPASFLLSVNSLINPILYALFQRRYRRTLFGAKKLIRM